MIRRTLMKSIPKELTRDFVRTAIVLTTVLCLTSLLPANLAAQLVPCRGLHSGQDYKILLDDFVFVSQDLGSDQDMRTLLYRVRDVLESRFQAASYIEGGSGLVVIPCQGRKPSTDSEFEPGMIQVLDSDGAVIEVWGLLDGTKRAGGFTDEKASVHFVLVPLQRDQAASGISGMHHANYSGATGYQKLFEQAKEIDAFVAFGVGIKSYKSAKYNQARRSLCESRHLMKKAWGPSIHDQKQIALINYTGTLADKALRASLGPNDSGGLRVLDQNRSCPGER
jgi:hypothetical protein